MPSNEIVTMFDDISLPNVPDTLPVMIGDPAEKMRPEMLPTLLKEYGEMIIRDAETCFYETDPHGIYMQCLMNGLRPEEASIALLTSMVTRLKPECGASILAATKQRKDSFTRSMTRKLLRMYSTTAGKVSHSVFSMLMEFLQFYLLQDHAQYLVFTDEYNAILQAQARASSDPGL